MSFLEIASSFRDTARTDFPQFAAQDFMAGFFNTLYDVDHFDVLEVCFTKDDKLVDMIDTAISAFDTGDKLAFAYVTQLAVPEVISSLTPCSVNSDVKATLDSFAADWAKFTKLPGWEQRMYKNWFDNKDTFHAWGSLMKPAWDGDLDFQAGQFYGVLAAISMNMDKVPHTMRSARTEPALQFLF